MTKPEWTTWRPTLGVIFWLGCLLFDALLLGHSLGTLSDLGFYRDPIAIAIRVSIAILGLTFNVLIRRGCDPGQARIYRKTLALLFPIWLLCWLMTSYVS